MISLLVSAVLIFRLNHCWSKIHFTQFDIVQRRIYDCRPHKCQYCLCLLFRDYYFCLSPQLNMVETTEGIKGQKSVSRSHERLHQRGLVEVKRSYSCWEPPPPRYPLHHSRNLALCFFVFYHPHSHSLNKVQVHKAADRCVVHWSSF